MKKQILLIMVLLFSTMFYAQNNTISIGPKTFKKEIACKINLPQQSDIMIRIFDGKTEIKHFKYNQVTTTAVKMNLESLKAGKTYIISVFDAKKQLLHTQEIIKSNK